MISGRNDLNGPIPEIFGLESDKFTAGPECKFFSFISKKLRIDWLQKASRVDPLPLINLKTLALRK